MIETLDLALINGITQDSRSVKKGYVFAALPGAKFDGRHYIADAVANGAVVILAPAGTAWPDNVPRGTVQLITEDNPRRALALLAARFYNQQPRFIAAVTGTNGKTSTVHFTKQIWSARNIKAASIGTLGVRGPGLIRSGSMTTPDPVSLHAELADLAAAGITHLAMEASSHGLDQYRLDGVKVRAAGFTNLTRDHLDYHGDMESYARAKARLFGEVLQSDGVAVLNADIAEFATLSTLVKARGIRVLSYGYEAQDLRVIRAVPTPQGQQLTLEIMGRSYEILLPVVGSFQVMNALCALGLVLAEHGEDKVLVPDYVTALGQLQGPPGRLQAVPGHPRGAAVYIDYAHTPDALETVLKALRPHTHGRLVCLFGCGGDRDRGKRPIMGQIAHNLADHVIITDDNPRSENPASIRQAILAAAPGAQEIGDRHESIRAAIVQLQAGDVLVIAGKGHEPGQIFADRTDPFDDFKEANQAIEELIRQ